MLLLKPEFLLKARIVLQFLYDCIQNRTSNTQVSLKECDYVLTIVWKYPNTRLKLTEAVRLKSHPQLITSLSITFRYVENNHAPFLIPSPPDIGAQDGLQFQTTEFSLSGFGELYKTFFLEAHQTSIRQSRSDSLYLIVKFVLVSVYDADNLCGRERYGGKKYYAGHSESKKKPVAHIPLSPLQSHIILKLAHINDYIRPYGIVE